ncbi:MAG: (2Fe-2S)-binding protein [Planctomycetota bacterium]
MKRLVRFELNGAEVEPRVHPGARLLDVLREDCGLTGTKEGCGEGECGACTVFVDGLSVNSCLYPALEAEGRRVTTIEGLGRSLEELARVQDAFVDGGGIQCGFCTPGMIMSAQALLEQNPEPSQAEIEHALTGNLCRCTGYVQIVEAIQEASKTIREDA